MAAVGDDGIGDAVVTAAAGEARADVVERFVSNGLPTKFLSDARYSFGSRVPPPRRAQNSGLRRDHALGILAWEIIGPRRVRRVKAFRFWLFPGRRRIPVMSCSVSDSRGRRIVRRRLSRSVGPRPCRSKYSVRRSRAPGAAQDGKRRLDFIAMPGNLQVNSDDHIRRPFWDDLGGQIVRRGRHHEFVTLTDGTAKTPAWRFWAHGIGDRALADLGLDRTSVSGKRAKGIGRSSKGG